MPAAAAPPSPRSAERAKIPGFVNLNRLHDQVQLLRPAAALRSERFARASFAAVCQSPTVRLFIVQLKNEYATGHPNLAFTHAPEPRPAAEPLKRWPPTQ